MRVGLRVTVRQYPDSRKDEEPWYDGTAGPGMTAANQH